MNTVDKNLQVGDLVNLPLDEVGIIEAIEPGILEYNYSCKIVLGDYSDLGGIGVYHENDLSHLDFRTTKAKKLMSDASQVIGYFQRQIAVYNQANIESNFELKQNKQRIENLNSQIKFFSGKTKRPDIIERLQENLRLERIQLKKNLKLKFNR